jgi:hypothetical protein
MRSVRRSVAKFVFGLQCLDVGGCDTVGLPSLWQLSKPDRFAHPCSSRINAIHVFIMNPDNPSFQGHWGGMDLHDMRVASERIFVCVP